LLLVLLFWLVFLFVCVVSVLARYEGRRNKSLRLLRRIGCRITSCLERKNSACMLKVCFA
jgi:hypothetical protein